MTDSLIDDGEDDVKPVRRSRTAPSVRTEALRTEGSRKRRKGGSEKSIFDLPEDLKAELEAQGLSAEFKRTSYFGKEEDPDYHIDLAENGWEPLSLNSHPDFKKLMPKNWTKDTFEKRGQMLMVRPQHMTDEARAEDKMNATKQVKGHLASLKNDTSTNEAERTLVKVKRSYERGIPIE